MNKQAIRRSSAWSAVLACMAVLAGCDGRSSPTAPQPRLSPPSNPAQLGIGSVAGTWAGTYTADVDCESSTGPASATFEQSGSTFVGILTASSTWCGFSDVLFEGTLEGITLSGKLSNFFPGANARGNLDGDDGLVIRIYNSFDYESGVLRLQRE